MKIILDTNVIYSGLGFNGVCRKLLQMVLSNSKFEIVASLETIAELKQKLFLDKFIKLSKLEVEEIQEFYSSFLGEVKIFYCSESFDVCEDKTDNKFFDLAFESEAEYLVSGDKKVLKVKKFKKCRVVLPAEFLIACQLLLLKTR